jgi:hypothetical protein
MRGKGGKKGNYRKRKRNKQKERRMRRKGGKKGNYRKRNKQKESDITV